jgi:hypothetical protein
MINQYKHDHEDTNDKGEISSHGPNLITHFRGNGEGVLKLIFPKGYLQLKIVIVQVIVQLNFFFHLFLHANQTDLLISLGIPLDTHHDVRTGILC